MADTDLLTLPEGKAALHIGEEIADLDEDVSSAIEAISEMVVALCGPVVAEERTERYSVVGDRLSFGVPVIEVSTVGEWSRSTSTPVDDANYLLVDNTAVNAHLLRTAAGSPYAWRSGSLAVEVTYTAGRCESTETVPGRFKLAAKAALAVYWRQFSAAWARTPQFDPDAAAGDPSAPPDVVIRSMLPRDLLHNGIA